MLHISFLAGTKKKLKRITVISKIQCLVGVYIGAAVGLAISEKKSSYLRLFYLIKATRAPSLDIQRKIFQR